MRKIVALVLISAAAFSAKAQKYVPVIKAGTVITYNAKSRALGQSLPLTLTVKSIKDTLNLRWDLTAYGSGTFLIMPNAVANGTRIGFRQPNPDDVMKLKDDETLITLSKKTFNDMIINKTFTLNGQTLTLAQDTTAFTLNNKEADVFYAITQNGKTKLWILNNPDFPLVCKLLGGPQGIDLTILSVKE